MTAMDVHSYQNVNWTVNNFDDLLTATNSSAGGYLFAGIDVLVFLVLLITLTGTFGWEAGILSAGFIGLILTLLFAYMNVLNWTFTGFFIGAIVVMIAYTTWSSRNN